MKNKNLEFLIAKKKTLLVSLVASAVFISLIIIVSLVMANIFI